MRIAIISDIHDSIPRLRAAMVKLDEVDAVVCCGDLISPFIIKELGTGFQGPIHIVFGNNDGDRYRLTEASKRYPHIEIHGEFAELDFDGRRFAVNHFDNIGRTMVASGTYDVVCFGHNHQFEITKSGKTLVVNPGEIYGLLTGKSSFAIYDTRTGEASRVDVQ